MKKIVVLLLSVSSFNRDTAEVVENQSFENIDALVSLINDLEQDEIPKTKNDFGAMSISDFMDACNNQEVELHKYWISYVLLNEKV